MYQNLKDRSNVCEGMITMKKRFAIFFELALVDAVQVKRQDRIQKK